MEASGWLRGDNKDLQASPAFPVMWAFEYDFVEVDEVERRASYGPWAPWFESREGVFPPPLEASEEELRARLAADVVCMLSEQQAIALHQRLTGVDPGSVLQGVIP